ncbi:hypothetical protein VTJ04DRAFT_6080 [Mycothermus thermophilus]|uniref:uncharacterized protein n=1 Tax=Humicola insolens TaxID=85995 RepID=UPI003742DBA3
MSTPSDNDTQDRDKHALASFTRLNPYEGGNFRPATSLTEDLPPNQDANILVLWHPDCRDILYTAYTEQSVPGRKLDITYIGGDVFAIARNLLLYTLTLDLSNDGKLTPAQVWSIWNIFYNPYLRQSDLQLLADHATKLYNLSESLEQWHSGPYGSILRFPDQRGLAVIRNCWNEFACHEAHLMDDSKFHRTHFDQALASAREVSEWLNHTPKQYVSTSCSPLAAQMAEKVVSAVEKYVELGKKPAFPLDAPEEPDIPNPVFAAPAGYFALTYPPVPLLSFHLAPAQAVLVEKPKFPLREGAGDPQNGIEELLEVALAQLSDWLQAFADKARSGTLILRHVLGDALSFSQMLHHGCVTKESCDQDCRKDTNGHNILLAEFEYGVGATAPRQFDIIDSSLVSTNLEALDILLATEPLLKDAPSSIIYTAGFYPLQDSNAFESLLGGRTTSIGLLLGLLPAEYWTNARSIPISDQILMTWSDKASKVEGINKEAAQFLLGFRLSWKPTKYLLGQKSPAPLQAGIDGVVDLVKEVYLNLIAAKDTENVPIMLTQTSSAKLMNPRETAIALLKALAGKLRLDFSELLNKLIGSLSLVPPPTQERVAVDLEKFKETTAPGNMVDASAAPGSEGDSAPEFTTAVGFDPDRPGDIAAITGRLQVLSDQGKQLLAEKAPIEVRQSSPTTLDVIFYGKERALWGKDRALVLPMTYPVPVLKEGSKTRIARTSGYIEITAPLAKPSTTPTLLEDHDCLPVVVPTATPSLPVHLNSPRVDLDRLPVINLDEKAHLGFITTLASLTFSSRERRLREQTIANPDPNASRANNNPDSLAPTSRLNFKESLFTMFMLSTGVQGGQTGLFALSEPAGRTGVHALILVSAVRLDAAHGSVVLDAAVLPFTRELLHSHELDEFLVFLRTLECCTLTVDEAELSLWKKALPAMAERCRTWEHLPECEYVKVGKAPVSLRQGDPVLCSCGKGKLPERFVGVPEWETAAKHSTRVAISPIYCSALVEELVAPELAKAVAEEAEGKRAARKVCRNCGKSEEEDGVKLKNCARCLAVAYCSSACQKKDWKKHRMECEEAEEHELREQERLKAAMERAQGGGSQ